MPLRKDLKSVLLIGSGPIVIGQACEFDYSGTQALQGAPRGRAQAYPGQLESRDYHDRSRARRPDLYRAYDGGERSRIIEKERPDALLPTVGGQTALNLAIELAEAGVLERFNVELIGAKLPRLRRPRTATLQGRDDQIGLECPLRMAPICSRRPRRSASSRLPLIIRPSRTLGGTGGVDCP